MVIICPGDKREQTKMGFKKHIIVAGFILLSALLILITILCLVPPISRDALVHHLALPKIYLARGKIIELPCMVYSYFPMNLEILYGISLYLGSDIVPKLIHFFFGVLTAVLIYNYLKTRLDKIYALCGVVLFFTVPIIIKLSITAYVDLGLVFFSTAALFALFKWADSNFNLWHLMVSGVFCGMAMGTKYNGFLTLILLTIVIFYLRSHASGNKKVLFQSLMGISVFLFIALTVYSPWGIRNYRWTGNPVYPLYNFYFNSENTNLCINSIELKKGETSNLNPVEYRRELYHETGWEIILLPIRIFFQGKDNDFQHFDGKLTPVLLFLPIFAFLGRKNLRKSIQYEQIVLLGFAVLFILFALLSTVARVRYMAPVIPALVVLSIFGIHSIIETIKGNRGTLFLKKAGKCVLLFVVVFQLFYCGRYLIEQYQYVKPFPYLMGKISKPDYISSYRPEISAFEYTNQHLQKEAKILFVYIGKRGYYCDREYIPDNGNNIRLLYSLSQKDQNAPRIFSEIKSQGITHMLINNKLFKQQMKIDLNTQEEKLLKEFIYQYMKIEFDKEGFSLYEIRM